MAQQAALTLAPAELEAQVEPEHQVEATAQLDRLEVQAGPATAAATETTRTDQVALVARQAVLAERPVSTSVVCPMSHSRTMEPFKEERPDAVHNL